MARTQHWLVIMAVATTVASGCSGILGLDPLPGGDDLVGIDSGHEASLSDGRTMPDAPMGGDVESSIEASTEDGPSVDASVEAEASIDAGTDAGGAADAKVDAPVDSGPAAPAGQPAGFPNTACLKTKTLDFEDQSLTPVSGNGAVTTATIEMGAPARSGKYGLKMVAIAGQTGAYAVISFASLESTSGYLQCEADINVVTEPGFALFTNVIGGGSILGVLGQGESLQYTAGSQGQLLGDGTLVVNAWTHVYFWIEPTSGGMTPVTVRWGSSFNTKTKILANRPTDFRAGIDKTDIDGPVHVDIDNMICCGKDP